MIKPTIKSSDRILAALLLLSVLMVGQIMNENISSIHLAALSGGGKPRVDVDKVKAKLRQAGLTPYEAKYWKTIDARSPKE